MILEESASDGRQAGFVIRPNRSMTVKGMVFFVLLVGLGVFLVAIRFVLLGAWVVLPFAILEIVLLAAGFWLFERASRYREIVQVSADCFIITQEGVQGRKVSRFNPHWVRVILRSNPDDWYPSRLFIRSHGEQVEIGACLTDQERETLSEALIKSMSRDR